MASRLTEQSLTTPEFWAPGRLWEGDTVALLGGGPSLRPLRFPRGHAIYQHRVIAINHAYQTAPQADIVYFCDYRPFWVQAIEDPAFRSHGGLKVTLSERVAREDRSVCLLHNAGTGKGGKALCDALPDIVTGHNSGNQAIQLAALLGARRILLLGFDMRRVAGRRNWADNHRGTGTPFGRWLPQFRALAAELAERGVEVINCTAGSALDCWPYRPLEKFL